MKIFFFAALYGFLFINTYAQRASDNTILAKFKNEGYLQSKVKQLTHDMADFYAQRLTGIRS